MKQGLVGKRGGELNPVLQSQAGERLGIKERHREEVGANTAKTLELSYDSYHKGASLIDSNFSLLLNKQGVIFEVSK